MKIKKGDKLIGINPVNGERARFIYLGKNPCETKFEKDLHKSGINRKVLDVKYKIECYVSDNFIQRYSIRKYEGKKK